MSRNMQLLALKSGTCTGNSRNQRKFKGHITDFKENQHMSLISDNVSLDF